MKPLFDEILAEGEAAIARLIAERRQERLDLEFKTKRDRTHGRIERDDQAALGKALSAFSNSAGGLIVYGVLAKPGDDGVDCASELHPISELDRFLAEVTRAAGELLMPRNEEIRVELIRNAQDSGTGYLAIYVERSERRPHRSEARNDRRYYKRGGSSSYVMEHYDIEDQFKRQERAKLSINYVLSRGITLEDSGQPIEVDILLTINIENSSSMTARFPYLHILSSNVRLAPDNVPQHFGLHYISGGSRDGSHLYEGGADHVIHPGISRAACRLCLPIRPRISRKPLTDQDIPTPEIEYRAGCENAPIIQGSLTINRGELMRVILGLSGT